MRKLLVLALTLALLLTLFAGCGDSTSGSDASNGAQGGEGGAQPISGSTGDKEIKVAIAEDIASLDPRNANSTATAGVLAHAFNKLVRSDSDMNIEPDLAERYEQMDDLTWRFYLREDVTFHDGSKFTAEDVVFTLDSIRDTDKGWRLTTDFSFMQAQVVDEYTVDISTEEPYPGLLLRLNYVMIIPKDYVESVGDEAFAQNPVGTGPYKYVDRLKDEYITFEAYEDFYRGRASIDRITFNVLPETAARLAALEAGEVMFAKDIPSIEIDRLNATGNVNVVSYPTSRVAFLNFNLLEDGPLSDIRVRQAVNYGIDRNLLINGVWDGFAGPIASLSCPEYEGFDPSIQGFAYDPERARELLIEAGYPDGLTLSASYSQSTQNAADVMQFMAAQLAEVGITLDLREMEATQHRDTITAGTVEAVYLNAIGGPYANIDLIAKLMFSSNERYSTYANPEFDALREQAAVTVDRAERDTLNAQLQQFVVDEAVGAPLYQPSGIYGVSNSLMNWQPRADEMLLFYDCDLA